MSDRFETFWRSGARRMLVVAMALGWLSGASRADGVWVGLELAPGHAGGLHIKRVMPGSPGEQANIKAGEELISVDGVSVQSAAEVIRTVSSKAPGSLLHLQIGPSKADSKTEKGAAREVVVTVAARPDPGELQQTILVGKTAPDFAVGVAAGPKLDKLSALKGQVVLIDFWATWCGPCVASLPTVQELHARLGKKGLRVIGITTESSKIAAEAARRHHLSYSIVSDASEDISGSYHVFAIPTAVVIDRKGIVRTVKVSDLESAMNTVAALLAEK